MISFSNSDISNSILEQFKHCHLSEHTNSFFLQLKRKESEFDFLHEHILNFITDWGARSLSVINWICSNSGLSYIRHVITSMYHTIEGWFKLGFFWKHATVTLKGYSCFLITKIESITPSFRNDEIRIILHHAMDSSLIFRFYNKSKAKYY